MWFLIIESRTYVNTVNVSNIELLEETKEQRLNLVYYIADEKEKFQRKQEIYDCCENKLMIKTYLGIFKRIIEQMGSEKAFK